MKKSLLTLFVVFNMINSTVSVLCFCASTQIPTNTVQKRTIISDKTILLETLTAILKNKIKGTYYSESIPYFRVIKLQTDEYELCLNDWKKDASISIFDIGCTSRNLQISPPEVSKAILSIAALSLSDRMKAANIIHGIKPGIIESDSAGTLTMKYHDLDEHK